MISIVIPFYNTRDTFDLLYQRIKESLQGNGLSFEMICVDDGSPQRDYEIIQKTAKQDERIKLIKLSRNFGQQTAITAGIEYAQGDWIVVMDADLQDRPEEIPRLLAKANEGFPIVYARRVSRHDSRLKKVYSLLFHRVFKILTGIRTDNTVGNFGIYHRKVIDAFLGMKESFRGFGLLVAWMDFKHAYIDVDHQERTIGKTSYSFSKGFLLALNAFIAFSDKPLKITALIGFGLSVLAMIIGVVYLIRGILGISAIIGWSSLMISIWFLGGIIIMIMGIMGLYLGKIFEETKKRPLYLVDFLMNIDEKI